MTKYRKENCKNLIALLEITPSGFLKAIYLCNPTESGQAVLRKTLSRLFRQGLWHKVLSRILKVGSP